MDNTICTTLLDARLISGNQDLWSKFNLIFQLEILNKEFINQTITLTGQQLMKIKDLLLMIKEILNNSSLNIEYIKENNQHYRITPYSYNSNLSKKLSPRLYTDLGEGLLEIIEEISKNK